MSVTEEDRNRARRIASEWSVNFDTDELDALESMISTFLADERKRARAPFLAIAKRFAAHFGGAYVDPDEVYDWLVKQAEAIRRAAGEGGE